MALNANDLLAVDWASLPQPHDDGCARHLVGALVSDVELPATDGSAVALSRLTGRTIVFVYPRTGVPGQPLPDGWDLIPGARGCTPHACSFRDLYAELRTAGAQHVFGLSTQSSEEQREAADRLHLPFLILSDAALKLATSMSLPTMTVHGAQLLSRLAMILDDGRVTKVFYPVFPPDQNASDVLAWLRENPK